MRLTTQLPALLLACFAMSCGPAYESGDALPISHDSISVLTVAGSGSPASLVPDGPTLTGIHQASIPARDTILAAFAASANTAALLPDLPSTDEASPPMSLSG